ncbi:glycosyltransferase family 4 protein [Vibrio breoganii]|uniref:glycosyltransferase family 4 protein n=1 Tax=Vibrio breoganii TaxID=553239 RepID=UPI000C866BDB|nr:glycosyltransferase family 4 protein [Vibrio breoganii]PMJ45891.1 glycosyltransferase WbuB [Vibrio breoganii]PMK63331.1 glycosyltransferase WbuB [Vibrio breoganii]PML38999.1 glycosyltransferase WbuB [Vibrio breoganii]PMO26324.1 glycosyltransferase WbuB [Vibrio breoganii]PMO30928.1 glycosyltransferase WbuB [Vibrio breoganii]
MDILYLHQYFATPDSNAGTRSYEMAKRFVSKGHKVTFVTSSAALPKGYVLSSGWNKLNIDGIELHVLRLSYSNNDTFLKRIFKFLQFSLRAIPKSLTVKSDVVFATSTPLTIAIPGIIYSKIKKVPMVFEVRDLWPELPVAVGAISNPVFIWLAQKLERLAYKSSTRLIGLSPGMCAGIEKQGIPRDKITLATNSCDIDLFDIDASIGARYKERKLSFVGNRKLIAYTGTFGPINDVSYIVNLAKSALIYSNDICFVAIGSGMQKKAIVELAKSEGVLDHNLFLLEPVPKTEIVELLSAADLSISLFGPIKEMWHNSANKLFDALASTTPIAINYGGWQQDLIQKHGCGLGLYGMSFDEAALAINNFLADSDSYLHAKLACKDLAYNYYSRNIMAERLENALLEAINDKKDI